MNSLPDRGRSELSQVSSANTGAGASTTDGRLLGELGEERRDARATLIALLQSINWNDAGRRIDRAHFWAERADMVLAAIQPDLHMEGLRNEALGYRRMYKDCLRDYDEQETELNDAERRIAAALALCDEHERKALEEDPSRSNSFAEKIRQALTKTAE